MVYVNPCPVCGESAEGAVAVGWGEETIQAEDYKRICVIPGDEAERIDKEDYGPNGGIAGDVMLVYHRDP